jgi:hypothetical protein
MTSGFFLSWYLCLVLASGRKRTRHYCKRGLAQMVSFLVVESIYPDLNFRFDVSVIYLYLIIF